jgi:purine nucleosidase
MKEKILLDTDIGSDIDDAVCLAYLLAQPDCDLLGITTVTGDVLQRCMLASALCQAADKPVPIYPGASQPLLVPQLQPNVPQAVALPTWPHETVFPGASGAPAEAIAFLRDTIRAHPGEVTLLGIGPLTNIALLFATDPEIPALLKQLVLMCGRFTWQMPAAYDTEWNAKLDPHAAAMVYRARPPVHRSVGLDVTLQVRMPADEVRQRFMHPLLRPVQAFASSWFEEFPELIFHDPLAAACIFDDQICSFQRGDVEVLVTEKPGLTRWKADGNGSQEIAVQVNPQRFFETFFGRFEEGS